MNEFHVRRQVFLLKHFAAQVARQENGGVSFHVNVERPLAAESFATSLAQKRGFRVNIPKVPPQARRRSELFATLVTKVFAHMSLFVFCQKFRRSSIICNPFFFFCCVLMPLS